MRTSKLIKKLAKKEGFTVEFVKSEMENTINLADWSKISTTGAKPKSIKEAMTLVAQQSKKYIITK